MFFEGRDLKSSAEPVSPGELECGATYFSVQFVDEEMLTPELEPLVFIGADLAAGDHAVLYFQDAGSYRVGIRFGSSEAGEAVFYAQKQSEVGHIFNYEHALNVLLMCSVRRKSQ